MKHVEKGFPYLLLLSYLILCHFRDPQIADSIIIAALAGFSGYRSYLSNKEQPNYIDLFEKKLAEQDKQIRDLQNSMGMQNIAQKRKDNIEKMVW